MHHSTGLRKLISFDFLRTKSISYFCSAALPCQILNCADWKKKALFFVYSLTYLAKHQTLFCSNDTFIEGRGKQSKYDHKQIDPKTYNLHQQFETREKMSTHSQTLQLTLLYKPTVIQPFNFLFEHSQR